MVKTSKNDKIKLILLRYEIEGRKKKLKSQFCFMGKICIVDYEYYKLVISAI